MWQAGSLIQTVINHRTIADLGGHCLKPGCPQAVEEPLDVGLGDPESR
jgi:hypothetical protein